jgi:hypothetical protein
VAGPSTVDEQEHLERTPEGQPRGKEHEADVQVVDLVGRELQRPHALLSVLGSMRRIMRESAVCLTRPQSGVISQ